MRPLPAMLVLAALLATTGATDASQTGHGRILLASHGVPPRLLAAPPPPMLTHPPAPMLREAPRPFGRAMLRMRSFFACAGHATAIDRSRYDGMIRDVATRHGLEYALVKAVIKTESDFDALAISPAGAQGLMQLMPATAAEHGVCNVFQPQDNVEGGCRHLRALLDRYAGDVVLALAAYNAGVQRVAAANGVPAISETRDYVERVLRYRLVYRSELPAS